ncbi:zinc-ribbon domain-containing protein [Azospirillum picis]|uniref:Zn finger-like uncharacterized protein n=1 Tax=Azospirillum picis TaxID=488438 RepID=A0ABU0MUE3_9PROT|nr:zinc-ribbon domain-containing protein [Azospirillum picis]MBP2303279.1 putative Zn finger-like uncharacterized protein [Azospirillum picis]MDQ0537097.1 putative Zn finger-like uncharacterized protein [Azospirillum picis]
MIVTCPTCSTRYTLPDQSVGSDGRKVKCARCGHVWRQMPEPAEPEPVMADAPTDMRPMPSMARAKPAKASKPPRGKPAKGTVAGFALLGVLLAGTAAAAYLARGQIVRGWPAAALLYETVGLPVEPPGAGLELRNIHSGQTLENGKAVLQLSGEVVNSTGDERELPPLYAVTIGADHKPLRSWALHLSDKVLAPGATATFQHSQPDPGPVTELTITFATPPAGADAGGHAADAPAAAPAPAAPAEKHAAPAAHGKPSGH